MADQVPLFVAIRAKDYTSRAFRAATTAAKKFSAGLRRIGMAARSLIPRFTMLRGIIIGALGREVVKTFAEFEKGVAAVATLTDDAAASFSSFSDAVQQAMLQTGASVADASKAMFDLVSAQVASADSTDVLTQAGKLAVAGNTTMSSATSGLIAIIKSYNLEAEDAVRVSDALFQAQKLGITTVGELSTNIGKLAPIARTAGIGFEEMLASVSALTAVTGLSTAEAVTSLRAALQAAIRPSEESASVVKKLGIEWDSATLKAEGLLGLIKQLNKDGIEPTVEEMSALGGSVRGFVGLAALAADDAKAFTETLESMGDAAGVTEKNFEFMSKTLAVQLTRLRAAFDTVAISLGEGLKPFIEDVIKKLKEFAVVIRRNTPTIVAFTTAIAKSIGEVVAFLARKMKQLFDLIRSSVKEGTIISDFVNIAIGIVDGMIAVFIAGIPLMLQTFKVIGRSIGIALAQALFGSTKAELARNLGASDGFGGFLKKELLKLGVGREAITSLTKVGEQLNGLERGVKRLRKETGRGIGSFIGTPEEIRAVEKALADVVKQMRMPGKRSEFGTQLGLSITANDLQKRLKALRVVVTQEHIDGLKETIERRDALINSLGEGSLAAQLLEADVSELTRRADDLVANRLKPALVGAIDRTAARLGKGRGDLFAKLLSLDDVSALVGRITSLLNKAFKVKGMTDLQNTLSDSFTAIAGSPVAKGVKTGFTALGKLGADAFRSAVALGKGFTGGVGAGGGAGAGAGVGLLSTPDEQLTFAQETGSNIARALGLVRVDEDGLERLRTLGELLGDAVTDGLVTVIDSLRGALSDTFYSLFTGDLDGIKQAFDNFFKSVLRAMSDFVAEMFAKWLVLKALGLLGQLFSAGAEPGTWEGQEGNFTPGGIPVDIEQGDGGLQSFPRWARGGVVNRATLGLIGEGRNAEAIVPLPDNRSIPVRLQGGGGQNVIVNVNFDVTAMDSRSVSQMIVSESATIAGVVQRALNQNVNFKQGVSARVGRR